jgi:hypothetical protein
MKLDGPLESLWADGHVPVQTLWQAFTRYPYLPRVRDLDVLLRAVALGPAGITWESDGFAVAAAYDEEKGCYRGLVTADEAMGVTLASLVVQPALALAQLEQPTSSEEPRETGRQAGDDDGTVPSHASRSESPGGGVVTPPRTAPTTFTGSVQLNAERLVRSFGTAHAEVLSHLINAGAEIEVVLEVRATLPGGFDDATVRVVAENARTLRFEDGAFN